MCQTVQVDHLWVTNDGKSFSSAFWISLWPQPEHLSYSDEKYPLFVSWSTVCICLTTHVSHAHIQTYSIVLWQIHYGTFSKVTLLHLISHTPGYEFRNDNEQSQVWYQYVLAFCTISCDLIHSFLVLFWNWSEGSFFLCEYLTSIRTEAYAVKLYIIYGIQFSVGFKISVGIKDWHSHLNFHLNVEWDRVNTIFDANTLGEMRLCTAEPCSAFVRQVSDWTNTIAQTPYLISTVGGSEDM